MMLGAASLIVSNAAVLLAARAILRRCSTERPAVDLVLFLLFRFALIMALVLAAGLAGALTAGGLGLAGAVLLAFLLARGERLDLPWRLPVSRHLSHGAIAFLILYAARALFQVLVYSPMDGDATSYHLPKVAAWVQSGRLLVDLGNDPRAWFPAGFELVEAWWAVFLHHEILLEAAGLEFLLLSAAAVWSLAAWLGLSSRSAVFACLATISVPGLAAQSISCLNDGPAAALVLAGAALVVHRLPLPLLVFTGALSAGVKPTACYALPGLLWLMFLVRHEPPRRLSSPRLPWALAALGAGLAAFWYLRNWIAQGTPLYPLGTPEILDLSGKRLQQLAPSFGALVDSLSDLADHRLYDARRPYHPLMKYSAAWGPVIVACGLPTLVWGLRQSSRLRRLAGAFALSMASVLALVVHDAFNLRFILWFPALPALAIGWAVERSPLLARPAALLLGFALLPTTFYGNYSRSFLNLHLRQDPWRTGITWLTELDRQPKVGTFGRFGGRSYLLYGPDFRTDVVPVRASSPEELHERLAAQGIRFLFAFDVPRSSLHGRILDECRRRGWLRQVRPFAYTVPP